MTQIHKLSQTLYFKAVNVKCERWWYPSNQPSAMLGPRNASEREAELQMQSEAIWDENLSNRCKNLSS